MGGILYNTPFGIDNPIGGNGAGRRFMSQGRYTDTYQLNNNASYVRGNHQLQMGGSWQRNRVNPYNFAGQYPDDDLRVQLGGSRERSAQHRPVPGRNRGGRPGDRQRDGGIPRRRGHPSAQTFRVRDKTSGYVPGIPSNEYYTLDNIALFAQDNWRWKPNFTVRAGLKWEYYSPLREDNDLGLLPILNGRPFQRRCSIRPPRSPSSTASSTTRT